MELTLCAYTFLLFSVVSATPHGYGTKGGASAKAEATAGAFDGVRGLPLNIPSGPGFSGSFSKSSSSSSSSASSSASSSSSSFSYGGSGSTGLHGFGTNSGAGASSFEGENGFAGSNGLPGAKGHIEPHTLVGANAFAGSRAQAGANSLAGSHSLAGANDIAGSNASAGASGFVEGNGLVGGISDCVSGYCSNNKRDEVPTINSSGGVATGHRNSGSNVAAASNAAAGAYGFTNGAGKTCFGSDCSHPSSGCEGSDCLNIDLNNKCTSGQCQLDSVKKDQDCSSGKCDEVSSQSSSPEDRPQCSSGQCGQDVQTNLPIATTIGSNDIPVKKYDATLKPDSETHYNHNVLSGYNGASSNSKSHLSAGIDSVYHSGNLNAYNHLHGGLAGSMSSPGSGLSIDHTKPATFLTTPKVGAPCTSPSCKSDFYENSGKPTSYNVPLHTSIDIPQQKLPCYSGHCGNDHFNNQYPTPNVGPLPSGSAGSIRCTSPNCAEKPFLSTTSDCKSPHCAPNYSFAPQGSGSIYPASLPSTISTAHNPSYASPGQPSYGHFKPGCKSRDCTEYTPGYINSGSNAGAHSQSGIMPTASSPANPSYSTPILIPSTPTTGHHISTPNNAVNHGVVIGTTVTPGHYQPTGGFGGPSGILKPNEFSLPTNTHVPLSHTGPSVAVNPAVGASPSAEELPPYTGGFGGPHGVLKPNEFDIKLPSTTYSPATSGSPSSHDFPSYTGGFGAPSGLLKPNEMSSSTNSGASANTHGVYFHTTTTPVQKVPLHQGTHVPPSGHLKPGDTKVVIPTAHLGNPVVLQPIPVIYPTHQVLPVHAHGLIAPTGSVQPNAYDTTNPSATSIIASGNIDSHGHHGHTQLPSGESNVYKDLPKYTGNFGGAPGVLKPNDFKESSNNGYIKPEVASNSKPNSCLTGTCNVESSNTVAVAKADAVAYTSGFGGPPGLLKPHDGGKLDNKLLSGAQFGLHHGSTGLLQSGVGTVNGYEVKTPAHGTYTPDATAQANAVAQAAAVAEATSGSYEGSIGQAGANGDVHKSGSGCGGGCGGGSYLGSGPDFGVNSALSSAKAGAVNGQNSGLHVDSASAKSHASAVTGARALGGSGSFASSSASAHSSAGYATKGGYGK